MQVEIAPNLCGTYQIRRLSGALANWLAGCSLVDMSFATLVDRVRFDFIEMPGMELTMPQATRLWNLGADDCRHVLDALVDAGFLKWTARRTIIRTGMTLAMGASFPPHISVMAVRRQDKTVGLD